MTFEVSQENTSVRITIHDLDAEFEKISDEFYQKFGDDLGISLDEIVGDYQDQARDAVLGVVNFHQDDDWWDDNDFVFDIDVGSIDENRLNQIRRLTMAEILGISSFKLEDQDDDGSYYIVSCDSDGDEILSTCTPCEEDDEEHEDEDEEEPQNDSSENNFLDLDIDRPRTSAAAAASVDSRRPIYNQAVEAIKWLGEQFKVPVNINA